MTFLMLRPYASKTKEELEAMWQAQAEIIQMTVQMYYSNGDENLKTKAEQAQLTQQEIQKEITLRSDPDYCTVEPTAEKVLNDFCKNLNENENQFVLEIMERHPEKTFNWDEFAKEQKNNGIIPEDAVVRIIEMMKAIFDIHEQECKRNFEEFIRELDDNERIDNELVDVLAEEAGSEPQE